jgi:hypothetical protein
LNIVGCCSSIEEKKSSSFPASAFRAVEAGALVEAAGCAFAVDEGGFSKIAAGYYKT